MVIAYTPPAAYFATLLESLYSGLEALDTTGYRGLDSDRWNQARSLTTDRTPQHLEALIEIGPVTERPTGRTVHGGLLTFAHRYSPDDDSTSQARFHAALAHAMAYLDGWSQPDGARCFGAQTAELSAPDEQWVVAVISFVLHIPRS